MSIISRFRLHNVKLSVTLTALCIIGFLSPSVYSQEIHYSLYQYSSLLLNPANTGNFNGDWRLAGNFRNQMVSTANPYRTTTVSFDTRLYLLHQKIGIGLFVVNDESGIGGLNFNKIFASLAYQKEFNKNFISIGFQAGYVFGSVDSWGNWNYNTGDFSLPNGETSFEDRSRYADINLGLHWKKSIKLVEPEIGVAVSHLNKPNISFTEGEEKESIKLGIDTRIKINISDKLFVQPSFLYVQKSISMTMLGSNIGFNLLGNRSAVKQFTAGAYLRNGLTSDLNTLALCLGTMINRVDIGLCYDMNFGQYSESLGSTGAFEISFIYRSISTVLNSYSIPCERY